MAAFDHKVKDGKLIRVSGKIDSYVHEVRICGDFFMHPEDAIWEFEKWLSGTPCNMDDLVIKIKRFVAEYGVTIYGAEAEDIAHAIMRAKDEA